MNTGLTGVAAFCLPLVAVGADVVAQSQAESTTQPAPVVAPALTPMSAVSMMSDAAPGVPVVVTAGPQGFGIQTADGSSSIRLHGNLAVDGRYYASGAPTSADTWLLRQVRPYVEGTIDRIFDYRLVPDFANGKAIILEAYADARLRPWLVVQAGKLKAPESLERLQFSSYRRFISLGLTSDLVPNRDLGLQIGGNVDEGLFSYAMGVFDGVTDGTSTDASPVPDVDNDNGHMDLEGRVFARPFATVDNFFLRGFGIGVAGTHDRTAGSAGNALLPSYRTPGQQIFFSFRTGTTSAVAEGDRSRWVPQFYYYAGHFGLIGEYVGSTQGVGRQVSTTLARSGTLRNSARQVSAGYFLTGEEETYYGFTPKSPFQSGGPGWGAFEVVLRVHQLDIDENAFTDGAASFADPTTSARRAQAVGAGLNWWLNRNVRWMLDYDYTRFEGGAAGGGNRPGERALLMRISLSY